MGTPAAHQSAHQFWVGNTPRCAGLIDGSRWGLLIATGVPTRVLITPAQAAESWVVKGRVVGVSGGDTIPVLDLDKRQHRIRFNGIDAPEKGQASGFRSKENLSKLIYDRNVLAC